MSRIMLILIDIGFCCRARYISPTLKCLHVFIGSTHRQMFLSWSKFTYYACYFIADAGGSEVQMYHQSDLSSLNAITQEICENHGQSEAIAILNPNKNQMVSKQRCYKHQKSNELTSDM